MSTMNWQPDPATVTEVTEAITAKLGSWGLGQLNRDGLVDAIWDQHEPFQKLDAEQQQAWVNAVCEELGWAPWPAK